MELPAYWKHSQHFKTAGSRFLHSKSLVLCVSLFKQCN